MISPWDHHPKENTWHVCFSKRQCSFVEKRYALNTAMCLPWDHHREANTYVIFQKLNAHVLTKETLSTAMWLLWDHHREANTWQVFFWKRQCSFLEKRYALNTTMWLPWDHHREADTCVICSSKMQRTFSEEQIHCTAMWLPWDHHREANTCVIFSKNERTLFVKRYIEHRNVVAVRSPSRSKHVRFSKKTKKGRICVWGGQMWSVQMIDREQFVSIIHTHTHTIACVHDSVHPILIHKSRNAPTNPASVPHTCGWHDTHTVGAHPFWWCGINNRPIKCVRTTNDVFASQQSKCHKQSRDCEFGDVFTFANSLPRDHAQCACACVMCARVFSACSWTSGWQGWQGW